MHDRVANLKERLLYSKRSYLFRQHFARVIPVEEVYVLAIGHVTIEFADVSAGIHRMDQDDQFVFLFTNTEHQGYFVGQWREDVAVVPEAPRDRVRIQHERFGLGAQFRVNGNRCVPAIDLIEVKEGLAERAFTIAEEQIFNRLPEFRQEMLNDLVRVGKVRVAKIAGTSAIAPTKVRSPILSLGTMMRAGRPLMLMSIGIAISCVAD